jgi:protein-arginine kinase activator protein McsA
MPIYLKDVLANPAILAGSAHDQKCRSCNVTLQETITGKRKTRAGFVCSDCYYEQIGAEIDQHPIGSGGFRRG